MSIASSTFVVDATLQIDGRVYVTETHIDNISIAHVVRYGPVPTTTDYAAVLTARATQIAADLVAQDVARILLTDAAPTFVYAAASDLTAAFRAAYRNASQFECARLANWLLNRITDGTYTDAQVESAFGLTSTQWLNTIKPKLQGYQTA